MRRARSLVLIAVSFLFCPLLAAEPAVSSVCPENLNRPCVALVLGGGGARGAAHIGVLKAIEDFGIPVDMVVGTSMGALVGGLYASGLSPEAIERAFLEADFNAGYRDAITRSDIPNRRQRQIDSYPILLDLGFDGREFKLPKGIIQGQSVKLLIDSMLGPRADFASFNELSIPFRAVATDIETGGQVVLDQGDLATAMQTSMAIPVIVRPIDHDGRQLVDGGIANNLPVSVARKLGAEIIIAVNISSPRLTREQLGSSTSIANQLTGFLTGINVRRAKLRLQDQDVLIEPELEGIETLSFDRVDEAILEGYFEARVRFNEQQSLPKLSVDQLSTRPQVQRVPDRVRVDRIILGNQSRLSADFILDRIGLQEGAWYTHEQIQSGVDRLYGQGTLARITTSWTQDRGENVLRIDVEEKEWGPGYLDFKLTFEDDFDTFSEYRIGTAYRLTNLSGYGAEWYSSAEFGTTKTLASELYWPLYTSGFFASVQLDFTREVNELLYSGIANGTSKEVDYGAFGGVGWDAVDRLSIALGLTKREGVIYREGGGAAVRHEQAQHGVALQVNYDSLDHASFPSKGSKVRGLLTRTEDERPGQSNYATRYDTELNHVISAGRHSLRQMLRLQGTFDDAPDSRFNQFRLGGFLNLSGLPRDSLSGHHARLASLVYRYQLLHNQFGALHLPLYVGASLEAGNVWQTSSAIHYDDLIHGSSLFIGWDSPLGPAYLAYGRSDSDDQSLYVYLGVVF